MQIFIRMGQPQERTQQQIAQSLMEMGWEILCTSKKSLMRITEKELEDRYDFRPEAIALFMEKRKAMCYRYRTITLEAEVYDTIADVKRKIEEADGTPADQIRLMAYSRGLDDVKTLSDYNIGRDATLELVLKLRGD